MDGAQPEDAQPELGFIDREILGYLRVGVPHAEIAVRIGASITEVKGRIARLERKPAASEREAIPCEPSAGTPKGGRTRGVAALAGMTAVAGVGIGAIVFGLGGGDVQDVSPRAPETTSRTGAPAGSAATPGATAYLRWPIEVYMAGRMPWHEPEK